MVRPPLQGYNLTGDDVSISGPKAVSMSNSVRLQPRLITPTQLPTLRSDVSGDVNGTIATTGNQSYGGDVELLGDTT